MSAIGKRISRLERRATVMPHRIVSESERREQLDRFIAAPDIEERIAAIPDLNHRAALEEYVAGRASKLVEPRQVDGCV